MTAPVPAAPAARATRTPLTNVHAFGLLYRTFLRSVRTRGRMIWLVVLAGLALLTAALNAAATGTSSMEGAIDTAVVGLSMTTAIGVLVVASAVLGDLYDNGSIVYVALRPVRTPVVVVAAWAAACTLTIPVGLVAALSVGLVDTDHGVVGASLLAAVVGVAAYAAMFGLLGVLVKRALPAGLAFLVIWEGLVSGLGTAGAALSVSGYLRSILEGVTGLTVEGAPFGLVTAIVAPLAISVGLLLATAWLLDRRELP